MTVPTRRDALQWLAATSFLACNSRAPRRERAAEVLAVTALDGMHWPTPDPFLFCAHHEDTYPAGNAKLGPATSLAGRDLGRDFASRDGWRMYHGRDVPGFPAHPHRGFETVTIVRRGLLDHSDSLGAAARYGRGDVQWLTAGRGIQHAEMFPLIESAPERGNPVELFQIWLNLPHVDKLVAPNFTMLWDHTIPRIAAPDVDVVLVAGSIRDFRAPAPPASSWAANPDHDVLIGTVKLAARSSWTLPEARANSERWLYVFAGNVGVSGRAIPAMHVAQLRAGAPTTLETGPAPAEMLVLQGRPIGEPVVQRGPFVMTTRAEIEQTIEEFRATQFGGWSWPSAEPVHGPAADRFARHSDGRIERPA